MRGLTVEALNPAILNVQYAVRGELAIKAEEYRVRLKGGAKDLPFDKVISSNIGNPQQTGLNQPPITFNRQVGGRKPISSGAPRSLADFLFFCFTPLFGKSNFGGVGVLAMGTFGQIGGGVDGVACTR